MYKRMFKTRFLGIFLFVAFCGLPGIGQTQQTPVKEKTARSVGDADAKRSVWKISFQAGYDREMPELAGYTPLGRLPYPKEAALTKYVLDRIVGLILTETKAKKVALMYGPGGYKQFPLSPSAQLDVLGTHEEVVALEEAIGYLARQNEVIASHIEPEGDKPAFQIVQTQGKTLHDAALLQRFWNRIGELSPILKQGFLPFDEQGQPGIRIINTEESWSETDYPQFEQAVTTLANEFRMPLTYQRLRVRFESVMNVWKTHPDGSDYLDKLRAQGYANLADRLEHRFRPIVARWVVTGFEKYGAKPARTGAVLKNGAWRRD